MTRYERLFHFDGDRRLGYKAYSSQLPDIYNIYVVVERPITDVLSVGHGKVGEEPGAKMIRGHLRLTWGDQGIDYMEGRKPFDVHVFAYDPETDRDRELILFGCWVTGIVDNRTEFVAKSMKPWSKPTTCTCSYEDSEEMTSHAAMCPKAWPEGTAMAVANVGAITKLELYKDLPEMLPGSGDPEEPVRVRCEKHGEQEGMRQGTSYLCPKCAVGEVNHLYSLAPLKGATVPGRREGVAGTIEKMDVDWDKLTDTIMAPNEGRVFVGHDVSKEMMQKEDEAFQELVEEAARAACPTCRSTQELETMLQQYENVARDAGWSEEVNCTPWAWLSCKTMGTKER